MQGCHSEGLAYVNFKEEIAWIPWGLLSQHPHLSLCHCPGFLLFFFSAMCEVLNFSADP